MGTPRDFEVDPISPSLRPQVAPPRYLKRQIYTDPLVFKVIDKHAVDEARTNYRTFRDLIWNLICKKEYTHLEKCRSIFRWMTTKNMYTIMFDSMLPGSPEQILAGFKDNKTTYARIFECLCHYAGLHCVTISGWAKGVDYKPGQPITQTPINHSWNAVHIDGNWQLVDSHWATRYLQNERNAPDNLVYEYDDFYFLSEPGNLIYSHIPEDPQWQLLVPVVARTEYEEYPLVKSFFFNVGMEFLQQNTGVLFTKNGLYTITLAFRKPASFTFKLAFGEKMATQIQGIDLKRYVIQETTGNRVTFYLRAPREGNYYMTVFSQTVGEKIKVENIFKAACEYKIVVDQPAGDVRPYPQCNDSNWGPGAPVKQYGMLPSHNAAILSAPAGRAEVSFTKTRDVRLFARVVRDGFTEEQLDAAVDVREQDNQIFVAVVLPTRGEYGLEIYANEPAKEGDTFTHMCQYLVSHIDRDLGTQYGQVYDRLDLAYSMQAQPELWQGPAANYGSLQRGDSRMGPGSNGGPQQYDRAYGSNQGLAPGGQYPGSPGQYAYAPGSPHMGKPGEFGYQDPNQVGTLGALQGQKAQYGSYGSLSRKTAAVGHGAAPVQAAPVHETGGTLKHGASVDEAGKFQVQVGTAGITPDTPQGWRQAGPDQKNIVGVQHGAAPGAMGTLPGGKQSYEASSADWDGNSYRQRQVREETEATNDGVRSFRSETSQVAGVDAQGRPLSSASITSSHSSHGAPDDDMSSHMESVTIGGKRPPPGTLPKPRRGGPGQQQQGGSDDLPPPPPELMNQQYQQHNRPSEKPKQPPIEIVYVPADKGTSPKPGRKVQEDQNKNQKPVEVVFTSGGQFPSPKSLRKNAASPRTLPKPDMSKYRKDGSLRKGSVDSSSQSSLTSSQGDMGSKKSLSSLGAADSGSRSSLEKGNLMPKSTSTTESLTASQGSDNKDKSPARSPLGSTEALTGVSKDDPRYAVLVGSRVPSGDEAFKPPAGTWGNQGAPQGDDGADFLPPPPLPSSLPPGSEPPPPPPPSSTSPGDSAPANDRGVRVVPIQREDDYGANRPYPFGGARSPAGTKTSSINVPVRPTEPEKEYQPHDTKMYKSSLTVTPPTSFKPIPIETQEPAPQPAPPSVPPKPFKDTQVFEQVDTHAVEVSKMDHKSFRDLVWVLIYARDITNELEKARAIFLWLCSQDLAKLQFDSVEKDSPEAILMSLQKGETTYAVVYETLCSYAGLHCKTLSGYAKGAEYKPGMKFQGDQGQHSWNAVLVDGAWRLVDCHWAARRLVGKKVTVENIRYELDEYYFMPDPHQLIFTHFPEDSNWQLLERSISLADFENLVPVKSAFFKQGLQILSHKEAVIVSQREITIRVGCPPVKVGSLAFTFTLGYNNSNKEDYHGIKLNRFGMQEMVDNVAFFTLRPPERESYRVIIYCKDLSVDVKEGVYGGVCEYELVCDQNPPQPQPFPPCVHTSWGPGDSAFKYGLTPLQKGAIFSTVNGQAEVRFQMPKPLRFTGKLKTTTQDEKALAGYVMHRVVADQAIFTINAPANGEYGLEVYANDPDKDANALFHAYQYLVICTDSRGQVEPLPILPPGYLGPQPMYPKVGLSAASHTDPYIQLEGNDLELSFNTAAPLRMTSQLVYVSHGQQEDLSDYILQQGHGDTQVIFQVRLPRVGLYKFQIYALPYSDSSESLPGVFNYLINCHNLPAVAIEFPKQYGQWKEGCFLYSPQEGTVSRSVGDEVDFRLGVPKANSVAVVIGEDWTQLEQKEGAWEGVVPMDKHWGKESKMAVCANYGSVKASYSTLLEYSI